MQVLNINLIIIVIIVLKMFEIIDAILMIMIELTRGRRIKAFGALNV